VPESRYSSGKIRPCLIATRMSPVRSCTVSLDIRLARCFSTVFTLTCKGALPMGVATPIDGEIIECYIMGALPMGVAPPLYENTTADWAFGRSPARHLLLKPRRGIEIPEAVIARTCLSGVDFTSLHVITRRTSEFDGM
jgi:hypothetical protein